MAVSPASVAVESQMYAQGQPSAIAVQNVTVAYDTNVVLRDVSFALPAGQLVGVIGPNGAGKTTLMRAILGLVPLAAGSVQIGNHAPGQRGSQIAYIPQRTAINWRFPASVFDVALMGRYGQLGWLRRPGTADRALALECLEQVGMAGYAKRPISQLSGGQQQRVFIARALAQQPDVLLLDEPISGVDAPTQEVILEILAKLARQGKTLLLTTHDLHCNMQHFDGLMAINRKLVALGSTEQVLTPQTLTATYGTQLVLSDGRSVALTDG